MAIILDSAFYQRDDVVQIAKELIGCTISTQNAGCKTSGIIAETEAYSGQNDMACHACRFGKTNRTEIMFQPGGIAYVYLCYGIHHLFNIVTNTSNAADAVLIRAIIPDEGIETMKKRRKTENARQLGNGPGKVSQALGITVGEHNGMSLFEEKIRIEAPTMAGMPHNIHSGTRIGVEYAGADALKKWRFWGEWK